MASRKFVFGITPVYYVKGYVRYGKMYRIAVFATTEKEARRKLSGFNINTRAIIKLTAS